MEVYHPLRNHERESGLNSPLPVPQLNEKNVHMFDACFIKVLYLIKGINNILDKYGKTVL